MYYIDLLASLSLDELTQAVRDEELVFAEFCDCRVMAFDGESVVNHARFGQRQHAPSAPIWFIPAGGRMPPGAVRIWSGTMLVENTIRSIEACR